MSRRDREQSGVETATDVSLLCRVLADKYRRAVIKSLDETHTPISRKALTTYVAKDLFPDQGVDFLDFRDRVHIQLHHVHLPLLTDAGIIEVENERILLGTMFGVTLALLADFLGGSSEARE